MFDIGIQEMIVIGVLALLVFGPSKLPELGRTVGRWMRELRRASDEFRSTVETNLNLKDIGDPPAPGDSLATPTATAAPTPEVLPSELEPAVAGEDLPVPDPVAVADVGEPFYAQRGARLFHRRECGWAARVPEVDRVYLKRVADARDQGFIECPVCEPWEPS